MFITTMKVSRSSVQILPRVPRICYFFVCNTFSPGLTVVFSSDIPVSPLRSCLHLVTLLRHAAHTVRCLTCRLTESTKQTNNQPGSLFPKRNIEVKIIESCVLCACVCLTMCESTNRFLLQVFGYFQLFNQPLNICERPFVTRVLSSSWVSDELK